MSVRYTPRARRHLDGIAAFISAHNEEAARRVGVRIRETIELLAEFPRMGHKGTVSHTLEMVVPGLPFIVVYRVDSNGGQENLIVLGIYHCAQLRPAKSQ
ncbi:hypothetical protein A3A39_02045 [Candidatus Kaiserbacteria bacterium RIFCSPLOWO2_01_FULL_54_13]|uniref:Plasmid stabilization protein n=1 Tax=Candidatus Kaiserbacteria bacterium RIFCSPLOWO2_01_FULL_54_13 TaxID=1798512 RepID=A0A1F6F168_9BACT|nr:MAG: hypothetical protein A3A39_02045 [Candidatus Kaiserbacteria bacterium RIFCSPLOWO2_01_FULL_54_13]